MTRGTLNVMCDDRDYQLDKGQYLIFRPARCSAAPKSLTATSTGCILLRRPRSPPEQNMSAPLASSQSVICLPAHQMIRQINRVVAMLQQLQDCVRDQSGPLQNDLMTSVVLCELARQTAVAALPGASRSRSHVCDDILDYIKWNIRSDLRVADIARTFGYNEKYLSHLFSKIFGMPLKQYILKEKIETAMLLIRDTSQDLKSISTELGFNYYHNFMRAFKLSSGLTPTQYRSTYAARR